jgi:hypothetical protein
MDHSALRREPLEDRHRRPNRTAAAVSSLLVPGSGQIYLGQWMIGATWLVATVALYTAAGLLFRISAPLGLVTLLLPLGTHVICFIDALDPQTLGPTRDEAPAIRHRATPSSPWAVRALALGLGATLLLAIVTAVRSQPFFGQAGYDRPLSMPAFHVAAHEGNTYLVVLRDNPGFGDSLWQIARMLKGDRPAVDVHFWRWDHQAMVPSALPIPPAARCVELGEIVLDTPAQIRRFLVPPRDGCH